jgi:uncharacterized protein (DUF1919 family)
MRRFFSGCSDRMSRCLSTRIRNRILKHITPTTPVCIVSDNCWGGELYRLLGLEYASPFVGMWISPATYMHLLENLETSLSQELRFYKDPACGYPKAMLSETGIGFMHYGSEEEARETFTRRLARFDASRMFVKVDFRDPSYVPDDITRWNQLALPRAVAFVSSKSQLSSVHHAVCLDSDTDYYRTLERSLKSYCWWNSLQGAQPRPLNFFESIINRIVIRNALPKALAGPA